MAITQIRPRDEPLVTAPTAGDTVLLDGTTTRSILVENLLANLGVVAVNSLGNGGLPVTGNCIVSPNDAGKVLLCNPGSPGLYTLTLPSPAGFSVNSIITIINNDSARGKMLSGFPADLYPCLFPNQALQLRIVNGAWVTSVNPGAWRPNIAVTLYVDPVAGLDLGADGLAPGAGGALRTYFHAFQLFQSVIVGPPGANPIIQLPPGGGSSGTSLVIANGVTRVATTQTGLGFYNGARVRLESLANRRNFMEGICTYIGAVLTMTVDKIGGAGTFSDWVLSYVFTETPPSQILGAVPSGTGTIGIVGNEASPTSVRWNSGDNTVCNGAVLSLRGFHVGTVSNAQNFLTVDKGGTVVFLNMSFGAAVGGAHVYVKSGGRFIWDGGTYSVGDAATAPASFNYHIYNEGGYVRIEHATVAVPYVLTYSAWYFGLQPGSCAFFSTTFAGAGSAGGSAGYQFAVQAGASIILNGTVLPGATAGYSLNGFIENVATDIAYSGKLAPAKTLANGAIFDASGNVYTVAAGATYDLPASVSGKLLVSDNTYSGSTAEFVLGGGGVGLLGQSSVSTWVASSTPGAVNWGVFFNTSHYSIKNGGPGPASFYGALFLARPAN